MPLGTILLILLVLVLIGALPTWGYSGSWGYGPPGILGVRIVGEHQSSYHPVSDDAAAASRNSPMRYAS